MTEIQNKFPGKDVTPEDLATKFPLVAKRDPDHFSRFTVAVIPESERKLYATRTVL